MNIRLTLVGLALLIAIVPAGAEDTDVTLKNYTDSLLEAYGPDATVTNGVVEGQTKSGDYFSAVHPNMSFDSATATATCGVPWTGGACSGGGTGVNRYCRNPQNIGGVAYEVQHDHYYTISGHLYRASRLLDCQATCTPGQMDGTTFGQLCP